MKRTSFVLAVLAAAVAAVVVAAVSFAAGGGSSARKSVTFHLVEKGEGFHFVDNPPTAAPNEHIASQGDEIVFAANLFTLGGKRAGSLNAYCVVTRGGNSQTDECTGSFGLAGGQLAGIVSQRGEQNVTRIAIVGGTGAYEGASGTVVSVSSPNSNISHDTVHLLLP
jgi:hypothetical protein